MPAADAAAHRRMRVVVDANCIIRRQLLAANADELVAVPEMLAEIRDQGTRAYLSALPVPLTLRTPSETAMRAVIAFARATGDLDVLSVVDIKVLALTYMLQSETAAGVANTIPQRPSTASITTKVVRSNKNTDTSKATTDDASSDGWTTQKSKKPSRKPRKHVSEGKWITPEMLSDTENDVVQKPLMDIYNSNNKTSTPIIENKNPMDSTTSSDANPITTSKKISEATSVSSPETNVATESGEIQVPHKKHKKRGGRRVNRAKYRNANGETDNTIDNESDMQSNQNEQSSKDADDKKSTTTTISPSVADIEADMKRLSTNEKAPKAVEETTNNVEVTNDDIVLCMTSDFAMQNVLLQMGLGLIGTDGHRIQSLKSWLLRCHACGTVTLDTSKQFCGSCGHPALIRTSYSVKSGGNIELYLKENFRYINRGNKYAIPTPKGGRSGNELILAEDQSEYQRALKAKEKMLKLATTESDASSLDLFPNISRNTFSKHVTATGRIIVGSGSRNVNAARKKRK